MKIKKIILIVCLSFMLSSGLAKAENWDLPTSYPDTIFHTQNIKQFAADVSKATDGKLTINVTPAVGQPAEIASSLAIGLTQIGEVYLLSLADDHAVFGADTVPFLATNYEDAKNLWDAQRNLIDILFDRRGMMVLFSVPWPPQGLYTKKQINEVSDLAGLKFRTYNTTLEAFANKVGAAPTQVEAPDIPQAFSTNRVEAMITSPSTGANSKAWDFLTHYTNIQAWLPKNIVAVNKRAFYGLDLSVQWALLDASHQAEVRGWEMSQKEVKSQTAILRKNGMKIVEPSKKFTAELEAIGKEMVRDWLRDAEPEGVIMLNKYSQLSPSNR